MKTSYRLTPINDRRPRIWDTEEEAHRAAWAMRKENKGYYLYQINEENGRRKVQFMSGWNPKA